MQDFSDSLPMMLYRALNAVMPRFRAVFSEFGVTEPQWRVLRVLWEYDEIPFGELAELTLVPAPSLVGVIDRLAARGLADRRRSEDDRRQVFVRATPAGHELERAVAPAVEAVYRELRGSLDQSTWSALMTGLEAVSRVDAGAPARSTQAAAAAFTSPRGESS